MKRISSAEKNVRRVGASVCVQYQALEDGVKYVPWSIII